VPIDSDQVRLIPTDPMLRGVPDEELYKLYDLCREDLRLWHIVNSYIALRRQVNHLGSLVE